MKMKLVYLLLLTHFSDAFPTSDKHSMETGMQPTLPKKHKLSISLDVTGQPYLNDEVEVHAHSYEAGYRLSQLDQPDTTSSLDQQVQEPVPNVSENSTDSDDEPEILIPTSNSSDNAVPGTSSVVSGDVSPVAFSPRAIAPGPNENTYIQYWFRGNTKLWVNSRLWLPHFINEQGYVSVCLRFDLRKPTTIRGSDIEKYVAMLTKAVGQWQEALVGEKDFQRTIPAKVYVFGIGMTDNVTLSNLSPAQKSLPKWTNSWAKCPTECSRNDNRDTVMKLQKKQKSYTYPDCKATGEASFVNHFDVVQWYSDFNFGSYGRGSDWGVRLSWNARNHQPPLNHEVGHTAGMPDVYAFPQGWNGALKPRSVMLKAMDRLSTFDVLMARTIWNASPNSVTWPTTTTTSTRPTSIIRRANTSSI